MSLRWKTLYVFGAVVAAMMVLLFVVSVTIIMAGFTQLETQYVGSNVESARNILRGELDALDATTRDYASWDDTYSFIETRDPQYPASNLVDTTFSSNRLNLILLIDNAGNLVYGKAFDLGRETEVAVPQDIARYFSNDSPLIQVGGSNVYRLGILNLNEGPMLLSAHPILRSSGTGASNGTLIMGRALDAQLQQQLANTLRLDLVVRRLGDATLPGDLPSMAALRTQDLVVEPLSQDRIAGYALLRDIFDQPAFILSVNQPRSIYAQGLLTVRYFLLAALAVGLTVAGIGFLVLDKWVMRRLLRLSTDVGGVATSGDFSTRVAVAGRDEMAALGGSINGLLQAIETTQQQLSQDIAGRERAENDLRVQRDLALALNAARGLDEALRLCLDTALVVPGLDSGRVYLVDPASGDLRLACHSGLSEAFVAATSRVEAGTDRARMWTEDRPVYARYEMLPIHLNDAQRGEGLRAVGILPIHQDGRAVACLVVSSHTMDEIPNPALLVLEAIAAQTGNAITQIEAREMARQSRDMLQTLIEELPVSVFCKAAEDGSFVLWNKQCEKMFGVTREQALGKTDYDIFPKERADFFRAKDAETFAQHTTVLILEEPVDSPTLGRRTLRTTKSPLFNAEGAPLYLLAVSEDISDRKKAEEQLTAAHAELQAALGRANQMMALAEAASRAKSDFLANMSHEIRTPMNGIMGMIELAQRTDAGQAQREYLGMAQVSAETLMALLNDILDLSKIEAGRLELEEVDFDIRQLMEQVTDVIAPRASNRGLELTCRVDPDVPSRVRGDALRLRQVLINLAGNSVKFTEHGEISIDVALMRQDEEWVELTCSVADTGIGIPPDKLDVIFDSFVQADGSTTRRFGGTGLGLAISRQLVHMMKGRIWAESGGVAGQGSTFHFAVRLKRRAGFDQPLSPAAPVLRGMRVLVVDDNATNRRILGETMLAFGCEPREASSGREALDLFGQAEGEGRPFGLILLDIQMPGMSGFDALDILRGGSLAGGSSVPVIVLTSVDSQAMLRQRPHLAWSAYVTKPVKQSALLDVMMDVVGHRTATEASASDVPPRALAGDGRPLRVLLAEDNEINRRLAIALLETAGHIVAPAENGQEVLDKLAQAEFDLIFMDVQMPVMDGVTATAAIRANPAWAHVPVIAMTAHAMKGDRERLLAAGMDDYVSKPVRSEALHAAIERQMRRVERAAD